MTQVLSSHLNGFDVDNHLLNLDQIKQKISALPPDFDPLDLLTCTRNVLLMCPVGFLYLLKLSISDLKQFNSRDINN